MANPLISIERARSEVLAAAEPLPAERAHISAALDRVLAQDVVATGAVPPFPASAMDGYAVVAEDGGSFLSVVDEARAGAPAQRRLQPGEAIRISTGAAVPEGADAVIRQEDVEVDPSGGVRPLAEVRAGENVRPAGEVMTSGQRVLSRGMRLGPAELAAAITAGLGEVLVSRRPRLAIVSTGDELRAPGEKLAAGQIHNSNALMLSAMGARAGAAPAAQLQLRDDRAATEEGLAAELERSDVVIVAGGVSVGPHDHVKPALANLGVREVFWGVALQPGKPTWFGTRTGKLVFGLPGNPVSAAVTFSLFAAPALAALQGAEPPARPPSARLAEPVRQNRKREQALRVRLERRDTQLVAVPNGAQGSHVITSLLGAQALAMIPPGPGVLEAGSTVALHLLGD